MCGKTRKDRIRNENLREMAQVEKLQTKIERSRLKWYGHVKRMDGARLPRQAIEKTYNDNRNRGRPRRSNEDIIKIDVAKRGEDWDKISTEKLYFDRQWWRGLSRRPVI